LDLSGFGLDVIDQLSDDIELLFSLFGLALVFNGGGITLFSSGISGFGVLV